MNQEIINQAMPHLIALDSAIAESAEIIGYPPPRVRPAGFMTFLGTIISQQIATEAAAAIQKRVVALLSEPTAQALLNVTTEQLRAAGLSYRKIEYAQGLSKTIVSGEFDIDYLSTLADKDAIEYITTLRGFGRWSAEIYLMFSLGRKDIFPADDLALQVALQRLYKLEERPRPAEARRLTEHLAPHRSTAALYLWHFYRGMPVNE